MFVFNAFQNNGNYDNNDCDHDNDNNNNQWIERGKRGKNADCKNAGDLRSGDNSVSPAAAAAAPGGAA